MKIWGCCVLSFVVGWALCAWELAAQTIQCVAPTASVNCTYAVPLPDTIRFRLVDASGAPMIGQRVTFLGATAVPAAGTTDRYGEVRTFVHRAQYPVQLTVAPEGAGIPIRLVRFDAPLSTPRQVEIENDLHWYAGRQLRHPVAVSLPGSTCIPGRTFAIFRTQAKNALASPDSVYLDGECQASTTWTLGDPVGEQKLNVTIKGGGLSGRGTASATARKGARLIFGVAVAGERKFREFRPPDSVTVVTSETEDGVTTQRTRKDALGDPTERLVETKVRIRPTIGVDWAPAPSQEWLRVSVSAAVEEIDRYFYVGLSMIHWAQQVHHDPDTFGVHLFFQSGRVEVASDDCDEGVVLCRDDDFRFFNGGGVMFTIDPSQVVSGLASVLFPS